MSFLREVFWFVMLFGVLEIVVEAIERRAERKRNRRNNPWQIGFTACKPSEDIK